MTAQELRIGNIVHYFSELADTWLNYHVLTANDILCLDSGDVDKAEPIPLTEEWLVRFGFEILVGWLDVWYKDEFDRFELTEIRDKYFFNDTKIEFVHQLQNAFFCIEQTELTPSDGGKIE